MFYARLQNLCYEKNISITRVLKELELSTSKGTAWKNGSIPNGKIIEKLANYFNVSTDYLLGRATPTATELQQPTEQAISDFHTLISNLNEDEIEKLIEYAMFLKLKQIK